MNCLIHVIKTCIDVFNKQRSEWILTHIVTYHRRITHRQGGGGQGVFVKQITSNVAVFCKCSCCIFRLAIFAMIFTESVVLLNISTWMRNRSIECQSTYVNTSMPVF